MTNPNRDLTPPREPLDSPTIAAVTPFISLGFFLRTPPRTLNPSDKECKEPMSILPTNNTGPNAIPIAAIAAIRTFVLSDDS